MLGIIGAMDAEVEQISEAMEKEEVFCAAGMTFNRGRLCGCEAVVVRSGVGKVNAAVCAQILCDRFNVDGIINTGVAGSLDVSIDIGDVVISSDVMHHDMDVTGLGYPAGQVPGLDVLAFKADESLARLAKEAGGALALRMHEGRVVSGDQFVSGRAVKEEIIKKCGGDEVRVCCTEMEGAAIAQTAYLNRVPFVVLRTISDKADDSAHMDYPAFEAMAIKNSVALIMEFMSAGKEKYDRI